MSEQLPLFPGAREYLFSLPNFIKAPPEFEHRCYVGGLDRREGLYVGNLDDPDAPFGYWAILLMDNGDVYAFDIFSLFPVP